VNKPFKLKLSIVLKNLRQQLFYSASKIVKN